MTLRVVELFAGIGAQASALERLGIPFTSTVCEIDPHAYNAYCAIHGPTPNLGDITKVDHLPECDLLTYSFPCQDLSVAGNQKGMAKGSGTRSSLLWEVERLLQDMRERGVLPEVLLMENVDAILHSANKPHLDRFIIRLNEIGYDSSYAVLNAKDFGVPQSRNRCFMVSTLTKGHFRFPKGFPLERRLKDVLEDDVPESFYLSEERIAAYERRIQGNRTGFLGKETQHYSVYNPDDVAPTLAACDYKDPTKIEIAGNLNDDRLLEQHNRIYATDGVCPTIYAPHGSDKSPKIEIAGLVTDTGFEQAQRVYGINGVAPAMKSRDYKEALKIEIASNEVD